MLIKWKKKQYILKEYFEISSNQGFKHCSGLKKSLKKDYKCFERLKQLPEILQYHESINFNRE